MATTLKSKTVLTRKRHQCFSCLRYFQPGTKMKYWVGIYEYDFCASYSCMTCVEIMNSTGECEFPEGFVREMLDEGQSPEDLL
jgi:hypothetical protein